jgi:hypothetical protein
VSNLKEKPVSFLSFIFFFLLCCCNCWKFSEINKCVKRCLRPEECCSCLRLNGGGRMKWRKAIVCALNRNLETRREKIDRCTEKIRRRKRRGNRCIEEDADEVDKN